LQAQSYANFEVILADGGSSDGCLNTVLDSFPWVKILVIPEAGIGESINAGIELASGEIVVFDLNSDEVVDSFWLRTIVGVLTSRDDVGAVAGKRYILGSDRIDSAGGRIRRLIGTVPAIGRYKRDGPSFDTSREVDYSPVIATRADVIRKVGLCDPVYIAYYEDTDFCYRVRRAGLKILFSPEAKHYHRMSSTIGKSRHRKLYYEKRNRLRFILKNFPPWYLLTAFVIHAVITTPMELALAFIKRDRQATRSITSAIVWNTKNIKATLQSRS
jgi:GT2 family glycosyltransferase